MKKKITAILMTAVMLFSAMGVTTVTSEAATIPFMTVVYDGPVKEKVGNYYIWVDELEDEYGDFYYELRCGKKTVGNSTLLNTVSGDAEITNVISNGQNIYYGVWYKGKKIMRIYKTSVTGNKNIAFWTITKVESKCGPLTAYNGRLYYDKGSKDLNGNHLGNIYSVSLADKSFRLEKRGLMGQSGYSRYITCDNEYKNVKTQLYDAKTRKSTVLIKSKNSRVYNGNIYYADWSSRGAYVKKTTLNGKKLETLAAVGAETWYVSYLGKTMAYFKNWQGGAQKKLIYSTKKVLNVK